MTATQLGRVDQFLHETWRTEAQSLAVFRMIYGLFVLLALFPDATWVSNLPASWFEPPFGPFLVLESAPSSAVLRLLMAIAAIALVLLVAGWRTRVVSLVTAASLMVIYGVEYSFGKIDHNTFVWLVPAFLAFSNWGDAWSLDESSGRNRTKDRGWPVALLLVSLAAAMATAGIAKIRGGWLDPSYSATRAHQLNHVTTAVERGFLAVLATDNHVGIIDEAIDWFTVAFELSFIVTVFRRSWLRWTIVAAAAFHLSIMLLLNIAFLANFCVYGVAVAWPSLATVNAEKRAVWRNAVVGLAAVAGVFAVVGHPILSWILEWHSRGDSIISTVLLAVFAASAVGWVFTKLRPALLLQ